MALAGVLGEAAGVVSRHRSGRRFRCRQQHDSVPQRPPGVVSAVDDGEQVLLDGAVHLDDALVAVAIGLAR